MASRRAQKKARPLARAIVPLIFATMYLAIVSTNLLAVVRAVEVSTCLFGPPMNIVPLMCACIVSPVRPDIEIFEGEKLSKSITHCIS